MFSLYVSYGNAVTNKWEVVTELPLKVDEGGMHGLRDGGVMFPNGESLRFNATLYEGNGGTSVNVRNGETVLFDLGGFKRNLEGYDPTAFFLTPSGMHVSVHIGRSNAIRNRSL
jgi:hypothetical protein